MGAAVLPGDLAARLDSMLDKSGDCWEWMGYRHECGYGVIRQGSLPTKYAHRLAWMVANQADIPPGCVIMHACDNPPCCNPAHLSLGASADNSYDMYVKGRGRPGRSNLSHCPRGHELSGSNLKIKLKKAKYGIYVTRNCRTCERDLQRQRRARS